MQIIVWQKLAKWIFFSVLLVICDYVVTFAKLSIRRSLKRLHGPVTRFVFRLIRCGRWQRATAHPSHWNSIKQWINSLQPRSSAWSSASSCCGEVLMLISRPGCLRAPPITAAKWRADSGMECPGVACANCVISCSGAQWGKLPGRAIKAREGSHFLGEREFRMR